MNIAFICNNHNSQALADLATKIVSAAGGGTVTAICSPQSQERFGDALRAKGTAVEVLDYAVTAVESRPSTERVKTRSADSLRSASRRLPRIVMNSSATQWLQQKLIERRIAATQSRARALLAKLSPQALLSISDRSHDYVESCALWAAKKANIPIILPFVAPFDVDAAMLHRVDAKGALQAEFNPFLPFSIYKLMTYMRLRGQIYRGAFFQAPVVLNAHANARTLSAYPWQIGCGGSDFVCVNSQSAADNYLSHGVPANKISIAGDVYYDDIVAATRNRPAILAEFSRKYGLAPSKKTLIIALPQLLEQGVIDAETHWREIRHIAKTASTINANVIVSLHPRMNPDDYTFIETEYGCRIADERLAEFIAVGNIFLATNSNTLVWSTLLGINTVVMNFRHLDHPLAYPLTTPEVINEPEQLAGALNRALVSKSDFSNDWAVLSKDMVFDGNTTGRYLSLIEQASQAQTS